MSAIHIKGQQKSRYSNSSNLFRLNPINIITFNKDQSESFLDIDVDGLHKILNHLHKLLPGQFVVIVAVIDGEKLIQFLLVK